jgi:hypothetical protein
MRIEATKGCRTFRPAAITDYLTNGGRIGARNRVASHLIAITTRPYDQLDDHASEETGRMALERQSESGSGDRRLFPAVERRALV